MGTSTVAWGRGGHFCSFSPLQAGGPRAQAERKEEHRVLWGGDTWGTQHPSPRTLGILSSQLAWFPDGDRCLLSLLSFIWTMVDEG